MSLESVKTEIPGEKGILIEFSYNYSCTEYGFTLRFLLSVMFILHCF